MQGIQSMSVQLKCAIILSVVLLSEVANAGTQPQMLYRDLIRAHGQPRSEAIYEGNLDYCYDQTDARRDLADTPAFKKCMLGRGYRWTWTRMVRTSAGSDTITYEHDSKDPAVGWHWEGGSRVCHNDCDNDEIPGSGFTCSNVTWLGMTARKCTRQN
jgi:hypothetical protein